MKVVCILKNKKLKIHKSTIRSKAEQTHNLENRKNTASKIYTEKKCCKKTKNAVKKTKRNNGITITDNDENFK